VYPARIGRVGLNSCFRTLKAFEPECETMSPFARKRARQVLSAALFGGIVLASSGVLLVLEAESAAADSPVPVVIQAPATGTYSYTSDPTFSGIATPGEVITLTTSQGPGCTATADSSDQWSCNAPGLTTSQAITATATGNLTDAPPNEDAVTFALVDVPWINGTVGQQIRSSNAQPTLTGTADPGAAVFVQIGSTGCFTPVTLAPIFADGAGNWTCIASPAIPDAAQYGQDLMGMFASQTPTWSGGRTSVYLADTYDLLHPLPDPLFSAPIDTSGGLVTAHLTNPTPTVVGTAAPNANVNVTYGLNGFPSSGEFCSTIADASGNFSCVFDGGTPLTVPNEYYVRAEQIDAVHPSNLGATNLFLIDMINPPSVPTITAPTSTYASSQPSVTVSGTADAGDTVHVTSDGAEVCTALASASGWSCNTSNLFPGSHDIDAFAADPYGNSSAPFGDIPIDILSPPATPTISSPVSGYQSSQPAVAVTGTAFSGEDVHVTVDGTDVCNSTTAAGVWTCDLGSLGAGQHVIDAFARDSYGTHSANAGARSVTILDPPGPPNIASPSAFYQSSQTGLTVTGTSATGVTVEVLVDGANGCAAVVTATQWTCQIASLSTGSHGISAVATDAYDSTSPAAGAVPIAILAKPASPVVLTPVDGSKTGKRTLIISGTSTGVTVQVRIDGSNACAATVAADGTWSCTTAKLALGIHHLSATTKDAYDTNSAPSSNESFTIAPPPGEATPAVITPDPTPTPTATPTSDPTPVPTDGKLAITGNSKPHSAPVAPVATVNTPTTFSTTLPKITATKITPLGAAVSGGVAGGFILLVAFPSELLKNTIRENYETAFRWLVPTRRWFAGLKRRVKQVKVNPWLGGSVIILLAALLLGFAEPDFGFNGSSARLWFALVLSLAAVNLIVPAITGIFSRRAFSAPISLRPLPAALLLVLVSALISRVGHIEPGFLFAGVIGVAYGAKLNRSSSGILALVSVGATVLLGLTAWLGYSAVAPLAEAHPSFWNLLWSESLSATTIESLATLVISLLPLRFLDGSTIFAWKKWVWAVAYFAALVILIFVIAPISDNWGPESAPLFGWGVFFILFALVAVGIWAVFRLRSGSADERDQKPKE
jgi:hypothetical protein